MLVHQLKELIVNGSIYCICKYHSQNSVFQPSENFNIENFYPDLTIVNP